jgi:hypothetical protein
MSLERNGLSPWCSRLVPLILVVLLVSSSGCVNLLQKMTANEKTAASSDTSPVAEIPGRVAFTLEEPAPVARLTSVQPPVPQLTPVKSDVVTEFVPAPTPDPYPIIHGVRINSTPRYAFLYRQPEFTRTYSLKGNRVGLRINVVQGPLYIRYTVAPQNDCLTDPESCRGTTKVPVNRPYMTMTVRDNETQEIVAESGYAREYSSDIGSYKFTITGTEDLDSTQNVAATYEPGPRYVAIYKEGRFQVTIEGNYLDVTISVITGASPDLLTAQENAEGPTSREISNEWA